MIAQLDKGQGQVSKDVFYLGVRGKRKSFGQSRAWMGGGGDKGTKVWPASDSDGTEGLAGTPVNKSGPLSQST